MRKIKFVAVSIIGLILAVSTTAFAQQVVTPKKTEGKAAAQTVAIKGDVFKSPLDGQYIVEEFLKNPLFSTDGKTFEELYSHGFGGSDVEHVQSYEDKSGNPGEYWRKDDLVLLGAKKIGRPARIGAEAKVPIVVIKGENFELNEIILKELKLGVQDVLNNPKTRVVGFDLVYGGKEFTRIKNPIQGIIVPLPEVRKPEYLFQLPDKRLIYVSADRYRYSYESFRLYLGAAGKMQEIPIKRVSRYRDGGTTYIVTNDGTLYSPRGNAERPATWTWAKDKKKETVEELDDREYNISDTKDGVLVTPR